MHESDYSLDLTERQRERFEEIKEEWSDGHTPEPSDEHVLDGLLDTKDAVDDGYYSEDTAVLEARIRKLEERNADKSAAINSALQALRNSTRPLDRRAREARRHLAPFALPRDDDDGLRPDGGTEHRPPCEAVDSMGPEPPEGHIDMERRVCPNCRLYFDVGAESDAVFCSGACQNRHKRGCYAQ